MCIYCGTTNYRNSVHQLGHDQTRRSLEARFVQYMTQTHRNCEQPHTLDREEVLPKEHRSGYECRLEKDSIRSSSVSVIVEEAVRFELSEDSRPRLFSRQDP